MSKRVIKTVERKLFRCFGDSADYVNTMLEKGFACHRIYSHTVKAFVVTVYRFEAVRN